MKYLSGNVTVMVSDMGKATAFYRDVLGFRVAREYGGEWTDLEGAGLKIGLHPGGKRPLNPHARHLSIGLQVDDLDAAAKALSAKGVKFEEAPADRGIRLAYFGDPDGNPLYLCEVKWG
jgi:catechol 2,3-dioxygenase-like lactoylglutathione lyase family enzyme